MSGPTRAPRGPIPGPRSQALTATLRRFESRNVTYLADDFPIFWESARDATVTDVDGHRYLDFTAAFGVAAAGHANPRVTQAVADQAARLAHGMGDVHPTAVRTELLERLSRVLPAGLSKTFLASTGAEAVEAALKTALLATGRSRFATYRGAYHGLSLGALTVCGIETFRQPFAAALGPEAVILEYPDAAQPAGAAIEDVRRTLGRHRDVAALIVEPIQGRAGCVLPPDGYLRGVRAVCDELSVIMIVDEIFTGFGRTGSWFAVEREGVVPDLICIGKAMGSGFPISAAAGKPAIMDAWPESTGEALHTSTFLGNPIGCAAALATIDELERRALPARAAQLGPLFERRLRALLAYPAVRATAGRGMFWGLRLRDARAASAAVTGALRRGLILLQSGIAGDAISISPPLVISEDEIECGFAILEAAVAAIE